MSGIEDKIKPLGQYDKYIRALIVADAGFGKTRLAGTANNALFLTTDPEGTISAKMAGSKAKEIRIDSWTEINDSYRFLRDGGIKKLGLEWLNIDNITEAQNLGMKETMELARKRNANLDEFISSQQDYLRSQNMLRQMVKQFNDLPVNVLWTAWQNRFEDADGESYYAPAIHGQQGALAQTIAGYMNVVGYGEVIADDVRRIWFTHAEQYRGKDRFGVLGRYRDNLDIPKMQALVEGALKKANGSTPAARTTPTKSPVARKPLARK